MLCIVVKLTFVYSVLAPTLSVPWAAVLLWAVAVSVVVSAVAALPVALALLHATSAVAPTTSPVIARLRP